MYMDLYTVYKAERMEHKPVVSYQYKATGDRLPLDRNYCYSNNQDIGPRDCFW